MTAAGKDRKTLNEIFGHVGAILGHLEALFGPSWGPFSDAALPGVLVFRCQGHLGPSWGHLAASFSHNSPKSAERARKPLGKTQFKINIWASLGQHGALLGPCFRCCPARCAGFPVPGPSWAILEPSWSHLGQFWGNLGAILGYLGPSWSHLGASWSHFGASWGHLRVS